MTLAERILELRTRQKLSQGDLAERLEVSRQSVSKWETGQSVPELDKLIKLADLFGVSVDQLVREGDTPGAATDAPKGETPPAAQPQIVYVERPRRGLTTTQILGVVCTAGGAGLCLLAAVKGDDELFLIGMVVLIAGLPLLLAKKHPWLITGWLAVALSLLVLNPYTSVSPWGLVGGLKYLHHLIVIPEIRYHTYYVAASVGIIRGLLTLALIVFTGRACGKAWKEKRFPEKDG